MGSHYDDDILLWSERQGQLLRRLAAAKAGGETPDWANVVEEIEAVGRMQLATFQSLLVKALTYDLRAAGWPLSPKASQWRAEARGLRGDAARAVTPSMRVRLDLAALYADALDSLRPFEGV